MVFCNNEQKCKSQSRHSHNPYFNRWFSAIRMAKICPVSHRIVTILILIDGFLQSEIEALTSLVVEVTILILIDGFLQYNKELKNHKEYISHNPYFNRWFSAIRYKHFKKLTIAESQSLF